MGKPLMIRKEDDEQIERLKERMQAKKKIDVVRTALSLLEDHLRRQERVKRWTRAASLVGSSSMEILKEFQTGPRFKRHEP
jgi:hypothetical protein